MSNLLFQYIKDNKQDALRYKVTKLVELAGANDYAKEAEFENAIKMITMVSNEFRLENYIKDVAKIFDRKPDQISKLVKKHLDHKKRQEEVQVVKEGHKGLPSWINKDNFNTVGFDQRYTAPDRDDIGIYFRGSNNAHTQLTNFTIKPLIHVYSRDKNLNRRLTEVQDGYKKSVIELPNRAWLNPNTFEDTLLDESAFMMYDGFAQSHLNKLKRVLLPQYTRGYQLGKLGWQNKEGFFAYSNLIYYKDQLIKFDEYGIAEIDGIKYLSMGSSNAMADFREDDDEYKNQKYLTYKEANLSFKEWSLYMMDAYKERGMMGVAFAIMAAFRDIISKRNNNMPIPYLHGEPESGKSKMGESIVSIFLHNMPGINLNQTTIFALWDYLEQFHNVPGLCNEFDEKSILEEIYKAFKGVYDLEGRKKGTGKGGQTKTQGINILPILLGQFLSTGDDGAVLQRTLPVKFFSDPNRPAFQIKRFRELKELEKKGLTSVSCHLFRIREFVDQNFVARFYDCYERMKSSLAKDGDVVKERILENFTNMYAITSIVNDKIELAFSMDEFFEYCKQQIKSLSSIIRESNALSGFWNAVETMVDKDEIEEGYDFKVETKGEVVLAAEERNKTYKKTFSEPKKLLYIRLGTIHANYQRALKLATGKNGLELEVIKSFMKDQSGYLGSSPSSSFKTNKGKTTVTSSYVFDYDLLGANLERGREKDAEEGTPVTLKGSLMYDAKVADAYGSGNLQMIFTLQQDESYWSEGIHIERIIQTTCTSKDIKDAPRLKKNDTITVSGLLLERQYAGGVKRSLEITKLIIPDNGTIPTEGEMQF